MYCIAYRKMRVKDRSESLSSFVTEGENVENQGFCHYYEDGQVTHLK